MMKEAGPTQTGGICLRRLGLNALVLSGCWLILSGHYDKFHLLMGLFSVCLVLWINWNSLRGSIPAQATPRLRPIRLALYVLWLGKEMILSALHVARVVLFPRQHAAPGLVRFRTDQPNDFARMILGNSITLTPGTLTLDIDQDTFLVHHLTTTTADDLLSGKMQRRVAALFGAAPGRMVHHIQRPWQP